MKYIQPLTVILCLFLTFPQISVGADINPQNTEKECVKKKSLIKGNSLAPLIPNGRTITWEPLACTSLPLSNETIIILKNGSSEIPLIKIIKAIPGDRFSINQTTSKHLWDIKVNGKLLKNSINRFYKLPTAKAKMLQLYERSFNGIIPANAYMVLGDQVGGTTDSSRFGLISRKDIIGVIIYPSH